MKVGIITYHWVPNFGANLQALATVSILKYFGFDSYVINYRPKALIDKYNSTISSEQIKTHEEFLDNFLPQTEICYDFNDVERINGKYGFDILISGSDAVFRLNYNLNREDTTFPNPFWLTFARTNQKKLFFSASSMGTDFLSLEKTTKDGIVSTLKDAKVLVRDKWTCDGLSPLDSKIDIDQSIDPVFLLKDYFEIPKKFEYKRDKPYIILNLYKNMQKESWIKKFVEIANQKGYDVIGLPNPEDNSIKKYLNDVLNLPIHPLKWYTIIQNSQGYVGVRFHPVVVAIANNVPFVAFDNYQTKLFNRFSSKTYDICYKTSNENRYINKIQKKFLTPKKTFKILTSHFNNNGFIENEKKKIKHIVSGWTNE